LIDANLDKQQEREHKDAEKYKKLMAWLIWNHDFTQDLGMPKKLQKLLDE